MPEIVTWAAVSVHDKTKAGAPEEVVTRGRLLPDYVDEHTRFVLRQTGATRYVEDPDVLMREMGPGPAPVLKQEHDPVVVAEISGVPVEDMVAQAANVEMVGLGDPGDDVVGDPARPADSAKVDEWRRYARSVDSEVDPESMTKAELISRFG